MRLVISFVLVALVSILIAFSLLNISLEQRFNSDSRDRQDSAAWATAGILSQRYRAVGGWTETTVEAMLYVKSIAGDTGIEVVTADGTVVYSDLPGTSSWQSAADVPEARKSIAPIMVGDARVGTVFAFPYAGVITPHSNNDIRVDTRVALIFAGLIAVILAALFAVFFSRNFILPLTHIAAISSRVQAGDLSARTNMGGNDEFSRLGRAVDEMIDAVDKNKKLEHQLTTDVAHELRTPLMAMQATIEAMIDGVLPMDSARLATLNSEVVRLGRLVDVQLELSRLESGRATLTLEELDLSQLVEDLVVAHEMFIEDAELSITRAITPDVMVRGDADRLRQAIANLLSNAIRYTPSGGHINVRVSSQQGLAQVFVSDTGIGIAEEDIPHVFSRFWRAATSRDRESGGLGVGLAMVREIVTKHQGIVHVESEPGVGSTFTLSLPLFEPEDEDDWD
jgi:signal transduction histidine kinase